MSMLTMPVELNKTVAPAAPEVMLADGTWLPLAGLSADELSHLQWEQEQRFARAIAALPKNSHERVLLTGQAYDTICTILAALQTDDQPLRMGLDKRYVRLVIELLHRQVNQGVGRPQLFEVGYGSGLLLKEVSDHGFPVAGVEISTAMREQAIALLGERHAEQLLFGDLREVEASAISSRPSLVYWNDVFEHICSDEIAEYLSHIYSLLQPGGLLVTITPNWLLRPSDVTRSFCPLRTEARGLHFKEYRLAEVTKLLKQAGFRRVATPLMVSRKRIYLCARGLRLVKQCCEPLIDRLPIKPAHLLCRGLGLSYTIATK
ncbi:MAG: class I SAM-dependent methyltransferase [Bythopirellula sp.]|nr:class I SAM-dependent methyltransferase [Bythopirellula sp.]